MSVIGISITIVLMLGTAFVLTAVETVNTASKSYGMLRHEISYDRSSVSEAEADAIAESLTKARFFDDEYQKFAHLRKVGGDYEVAVSVFKSVLKNPDNLNQFARLRNEMQTSFPNNKIIINLIVDSYDNVLKRIE